MPGVAVRGMGARRSRRPEPSRYEQEYMQRQENPYQRERRLSREARDNQVHNPEFRRWRAKPEADPPWHQRLRQTLRKVTVRSSSKRPPKARRTVAVAEAVDAEPPLADVVAPRRRTLLDRLFVGLRIHPVARPVDDG